MKARIHLNKETGEVTHIYDDRFQGIDKAVGGTPQISRASHVEPDADGLWFSDLSPIGGPRFERIETHAEALAVERAWIEQYILGMQHG